MFPYDMHMPYWAWQPRELQLRRGREIRDSVELSPNPACMDQRGVMHSAYLQVRARALMPPFCLRCQQPGHADRVKGGTACTLPPVRGPMPRVADAALRHNILPDEADPIHTVHFHDRMAGPQGAGWGHLHPSRMGPQFPQ